MTSPENHSIFVSIAAFCDPYLRFTIKSLFAEAKHPEALTLGVVDQSLDSLGPWLAEQPFADQVRYLHVDPLHSRGVCWARHLAQTLYDDEAWFLQVDSHTWFASGWDDVLRQHLRGLLILSKKPVLTTYPPGFEFNTDGLPVKRISPSEQVARFGVKPGQSLTADNPVLTFKVVFEPLPMEEEPVTANACHYVRGFHLAGGFLFTLGQFVRDVPYDPLFYFHGEEQGLALRAFTRGWELYHPQFHRVPLFHLYKMPKSASPNLHWREDLEARRSIKWPERRRRAQQRLSELLAGRLQAPYALGAERSLEAFVKCSGIDYPNLRIAEPDVEFVRVGCG